MRELNGWVPRTVTLDTDGSVISVSVTQSRFTRAEVDRLLNSRRSEFADRSPTGILLSEATDPANQFAFVVPPPITDHSQVALSKAKKEWLERHKDTPPETRLWRVEMREG